ncbi:MAG: HAD family phosphatase [Firmicutes bacterium]|jgi:Cof subfamily protein (haloacid dehalogenase superfamily)|nr:HAD family phosphatase [Bacillota bacterium]
MAYRLIVMDLDETLLGQNFEISERNLSAIKKAQDRGIKATIATGRMFRSSLPYIKRLKIREPVIVYHGAMVRAVETGEDLYHYPIDYEMALPIVEAAEEFGYHVNLYADDQVHIKEEGQFSRLYQKIAAVEVKPVGSLHRYLENTGTSPTKLSIIDFDGNLARMESFLQEKYGRRLVVTKSLGYFLEVTHPRATKGQALEFLAGKMGIKAEEIAAFGNSYNDIDMLEYVGLGVVVDNAPPVIKEVADLVTGSNVEDGVAEAIENYII